MKCPKCGGQTHIENTYHLKDKTEIRRLHKCLNPNCLNEKGKRFTFHTFENYEKKDPI
jgi:transcriptional regulator NrdR family protein